ncbi:MAG: beta strand repeat-containing protein, partial [Acidimicrobiales bacterium]
VRRARKLVVVLGVVAGFSVAAAGTAFAFWTFVDSSNTQQAEATAGRVGAGGQPGQTGVSGRDVTIAWSAAAQAGSYSVTRSNAQGLSNTEHGTCASSTTGLTCSDAGVVESGTSTTNWSYTDTPARSLWTGPTSPPSATISVPGPTLALGSSSFAAGGGSTSATVANFFDNEAVTYCVDQSSSCSAGHTLGTDTVPGSGGAKTTASISIPAGLSAGSHAVYAIGSLGSLPSATITVGTGVLDHFVVTAPPSTIVGQPFSITVTAQDSNGDTLTGFAGTVHFTSTDSGASVPGDYTFTVGAGADDGVHSFTNGATLYTVGSGTQTVTAASGAKSGTSSPITVGKATTTTSLSESPSATAVYGDEQAVTFTSNVVPQYSGSPTGTVTVKTGSTTLCTITRPATSCSTTASALNASGSSYPVTATYNGDGNFTASTSAAQSFTVGQDSAALSTFSVNSPATYGSETSLVFSATVTAGHGEGIPGTDTVTITQGATAICTMTLSTGSCRPASGAVLPAGTYTNGIIATFNKTGADGNFGATATATASLTVDKAASSTGLTLSHQPSVTYGAESAETFTATVNAVAGGTTPTGTVAVTAGETGLCTITLSGGTGSCVLPDFALAGGSYGNIVGTFSADGNYSASASGSQSLVVSPATSGASLSQSDSTPVFGSENSDTMSITVTGASGGAAPTGTLSMEDAATGTVICQVDTLTPSGSTATGRCAPSASQFPAGTSFTTVTATYNGDGNYATSSSAPGQAFTVDGPPAISSADSTIFAPGTAGSFSVTTTGFPTGASMHITNAAFSGCTPSALPPGVTFHDNADGTLSIASSAASPAGTTAICINASNGIGTPATQVFTLTIGSNKLVITSAAVTGAATNSPTLGPLTVTYENAAGVPITTGVTVSLSSSSTGAKEFSLSSGGATVTSVTISPGSQAATFYYGDTLAATPTITVSASGEMSGTQIETVHAGAPHGLTFTSCSTTGHGSSATCNADGTATVTMASGDGGGTWTADVALIDAYGNAATNTSGSAIPVAITHTAKGPTITGSPLGIADGASQSSTSFTYSFSKAPKGGTDTVTASSASLASATSAITSGDD